METRGSMESLFHESRVSRKLGGGASRVQSRHRVMQEPEEDGQKSRQEVRGQELLINSIGVLRKGKVKMILGLE